MDSVVTVTVSVEVGTYSPSTRIQNAKSLLCSYLISFYPLGMVIGLPPVLNFGKGELQKRVLEEVLSGKKYISLAISEAFAGSDVSGLRTTAEKTPDGKHYIVTGTKK